MRQELPGVSDEIINRIYGSIEILRTDYEPGNPVREGAIRAYARTNGIIFITAAVISSLSILFSLLMPSICSYAVSINVYECYTSQITTSEISTTLLQAQV